MPLFDLFGVKKDLRPEEDAPAAAGPAGSAPPGKGSRSGWGIILALNTVLILGASGVLATRVIDHLSQAPAVAAPQRPPPKGGKAPAAAAPAADAKPEKTPEEKAPEAKVPEKKAPPAAAKPAGKPATRPVPFTYTGNGAKEVALVGPFLVRTGGRKPMFKNSKGAWQLTIYLNIGESYKYRFEVTDAQGRRKLTPAETVEVLQP